MRRERKKVLVVSVFAVTALITALYAPISRYGERKKRQSAGFRWSLIPMWGLFMTAVMRPRFRRETEQGFTRLRTWK